MSLHINQIVLHQLVKNEQQQVNVMLRDKPLEQNLAVDSMMADLHRVYNTKSKTYAIFNDDSEFASRIKRYRDGENDFLTFSQAAMHKLMQDAAQFAFLQSSIVIFCHYRYLAADFLLIGLLDSRNSTLVNEQLDITSTHYLNIEHADAIARIDLTEWETDPQSVRYISFLKGRVGRKVPELFIHYFSAKEGLNAKVQNQGLLKAVDDFCVDSELDKNSAQSYREQVYSYCHDQLQAGEEIVIQALSAELPSQAGKNFQQFVQDNGYELDAHFPADRSTLRQLTKLSGGGGGLSISFDAQLLDERIIWDPINDTLTIKGTPQNLRNQLLRRLANGED